MKVKIEESRIIENPSFYSLSMGCLVKKDQVRKKSTPRVTSIRFDTVYI